MLTTLVAICVGMLMVQSGIAKRQLAWRPPRPKLWRAEAGVEYARRVGFDAEARATIAPTTWQGIVDVAEEIDAAIIVIGSRGLRGLREFARGSVSHDVARHARRAVLIVPPVTT